MNERNFINNKNQEEGKSTLIFGKSSHRDFFENRDWGAVVLFWKNNVILSNLDILTNKNEYGVTNIKEIHDLGHDEFLSNDPRYRRKTFAMRIGYNGTAYNGK